MDRYGQRLGWHPLSGRKRQRYRYCMVSYFRETTQVEVACQEYKEIQTWTKEQRKSMDVLADIRVLRCISPDTWDYAHLYQYYS